MNAPKMSSSDYTTIKVALLCLPATCRYHGEDVERKRASAPMVVEPCCETGGPTMLRNRALIALNSAAGVSG